MDLFNNCLIQIKMKKVTLLLLSLISISLLSSCGESNEEREARIKREIQDSIRVANEKAELLRLQKEEEEERIKEEQERIKQEEQKKWEATTDGKGWLTLKANLVSPSTAVLAGYNGVDNPSCIEMAEALDLEGLQVASYMVDSQNSYGAMIRKKYIVFFKDGEPMHIEDGERLTGNVSSLRMALRLSGMWD